MKTIATATTQTSDVRYKTVIKTGDFALVPMNLCMLAGKMLARHLMIIFWQVWVPARLLPCKCMLNTRAGTLVN